VIIQLKTGAKIVTQPINVPAQEAKAAKEGYLHRTLVALDQFGNVILGGDPDETISARSARAAARGDWLGKAMCWWLDKIQPQHGPKAEAGDLERADKVAEIESTSLGVKQ
jgi:hypothetical protein